MSNTQTQANVYAGQQNGPSPTRSVNHKKGLEVAVDVGNRMIKYYCTGGDVKTVPSWHKDLEEWDNPEQDSNSIVVKYLRGDNQDLIGESWAVGTVAQDLGGTPTF